MLNCAWFIFRPNPDTNLFSIGFPTSENMPEKTLDILNILGKKVIESIIGLTNPWIDCSKLPAGYYFICLLVDETYQLPEKFLKH